MAPFPRVDAGAAEEEEEAEANEARCLSAHDVSRLLRGVSPGEHSVAME
jgi:hypothetical protein